MALRESALVGKPTAYIGAFLGVAGVALAIVGLHDPFGANPVTFLLGLLWLLVVSVRLAVKPGTDSAPDQYDAPADARVAVTV